jgi:hypothetical protein
MHAKMNSLHGRMSAFLAAGFVGLLLSGNPTFAQFVSREQIVEALTQPASLNFTDRLRLTRSLTLKSGDYAVASVQPKASIDLHEILLRIQLCRDHRRSGAAVA